MSADACDLPGSDGAFSAPKQTPKPLVSKPGRVIQDANNTTPTKQQPTLTQGQIGGRHEIIDGTRDERR